MMNPNTLTEINLKSLHHLKRFNWTLLLGVGIVSIVFLVAIFGPHFASQDPMENHFSLEVRGQIRTPPYPAFTIPGFPLGTDQFGRDILSRLLYGVRPTLLMVTVVALIRLGLGIFLGLATGWSDGFVGNILEGILSAALAIPVLLVALIGITAIGINRGMLAFILGLTLTGWAETSRIISEQTRLLRQQPFIESARSLGGNDSYILARHIMPQVMPLVWNLLAFEISSTLLVAAELGFLGYFIGGGVWTEVTDFVTVNVEGLPELGQMLSSALVKLTDPSAIIAVGGTIFFSILGFNLLGEGLRTNTNTERIVGGWWKRFLGERWGAWIEFRFIPMLGDWFSMHINVIGYAFLGLLVIIIGLVSFDRQHSVNAIESPVISSVPGDHLWASTGQNNRNTRWTAVVGPRDKQLLWFYHAGGNIPGGPVVKADGTIILASENKKLAAINPDGVELWRVDLDENPVGTPGLGERGEIYVADKSGGLATFAPNGGRLWYFSEKRGREAVSGPVVASDGTIYYNRLDVVQALDLFGKPLWQSPSVGEYLDTAPVLSPKESFLFVKKLALSAESGARLVLEGIPVDDLVYLDPEYFVGADNSTYFRKGSDLYRWRSTETGVELDKPVSWSYNISNTPVFPTDQGVTPEGILWLFFGFESWNNRLVTMDTQGRVLSNVQFNFREGILVGIDGESIAYICASNGGFRASCQAIQLGSDQSLWELNFGNNAQFMGGAVVSGRLYLTLKSGYLVAIGEP